MKQQKFLNNDDEPEIETVVETLSEGVRISKNHLRKIVKNCMKQNDDDPCDFAFNFLECYLNDESILQYSKTKFEL